jgi:hypothetical protein
LRNLHRPIDGLFRLCRLLRLLLRHRSAHAERERQSAKDDNVKQNCAH